MTAIPFEPAGAGHAPRRVVRATTGAAWWLAAIVVTTVLGFRGPVAKHGLDLAHAVHGTMALGWSLLLVVQAGLADARRRRAHRWFAVAGVTFAAGLVTSSVPMLHDMAGAAVAKAGFRPMGYQLLAMDVMLMLLFVALFAIALAFVRQPAVHSRALACTGLLALPPGLGRAYMSWAGVDPITGSHMALASGSLLLVALIVRDRRAGQREPVYPAMLAACVAVQLLFPVIARSAWFDGAMRVFAAA